MKTKRKNEFLNVLMVVLILVIAVCGIMTVGSFRGWFEKREESYLYANRVIGVANIERKGISYSLRQGQILEKEDMIRTKQGSSAEISVGEKGEFVLNENSEMMVLSCDEKEMQLQMEQGELFADMVSADTKVQAEFRLNKMCVDGAVFSVSVQSGSVSLHVYSGEAEMTLEDGKQAHAEAGEKLMVSQDAYGESHVSVERFQAAELNEFLILQMQKCRSKDQMVFSSDELQEVLDKRASQKKAALETGMNSVIPLSENREEESETGSIFDPETEESERKKSYAAGSYVEEYIPEPENVQDYDSPQMPVNEQPVLEQPVQEQPAAAPLTCTIEIRCGTILDNMNQLEDGKEAYVPANGYILAASTVEFEEGETVFDILSRVCEYAGIQLEYSWTPVYNSYYIEGINHLYEFDCGNESGWMYQVNGWFPDYGCSSYTVQDGDSIVWCYTCNGLGADVGAK